MSIKQLGRILVFLSIGSFVYSMEPVDTTPVSPKVHRPFLTIEDMREWRQNASIRKEIAKAESLKLKALKAGINALTPAEALRKVNQEFEHAKGVIVACDRVPKNTSSKQTELEKQRQELVKIKRVFDDTPDMYVYAQEHEQALYAQLVPDMITLIELGVQLTELTKRGVVFEKLATEFQGKLSVLIENYNKVIRSFDQFLKKEMADLETALVRKEQEVQKEAAAVETMQEGIRARKEQITKGFKVQKNARAISNNLEPQLKQAEAKKEHSVQQCAILFHSFKQSLQNYAQKQTYWAINDVGALLNAMIAQLDKEFIIRAFNRLEADQALRNMVGTAIERFKAIPGLYEGLMRTLQNYLLLICSPDLAPRAKGYEWEITVACWLYKTLVEHQDTMRMNSMKSLRSRDFSREFDIVLEEQRVLIECKNRHWHTTHFSKIHQQFLDQKEIAQELKYLFMIVSRHTLDYEMRRFLRQKDILYLEPGTSLELSILKEPCNTLYTDTYCTHK